MPLAIRRYRPDDLPGVERLNARLAAAGSEHVVYPEAPEQSAADAGGPRFDRLLVAAEGGEVHGGVWLTEQGLRLNGADVRAGWIKYPVSESLIDPRFSGVPGALVFQMMRETPYLLSLGLGGHHTPFARLLAKLRWTGITVPFLFRILRPARVLRELRYLRSSAARRWALDALAWSGLAWLGHRLFCLVRGIGRARVPAGITAEPVAEFGPWSDQLWADCRDHYALISARDAATLNALYPAATPGLTILRVRRDGRVIGWACLLRFDLRQGAGHRVFGRLAVGALADCLAAPADAAAVAAIATATLLQQPYDLLVSNQSHADWCAALRAQGFLEGPSNFACYRAPKVEAALAAAPDGRGIHLTRGDGDGPRWA